jgi:hypothetical protein
MSELYQSLSHSKWDCKYHVVFVPKRRRKTILGQTRRHLGQIFHGLAPDLCAAPAPRVRAEAQRTIWGPRKHGVKQKVCEVHSFANRPQGGHPNGYEQKRA